MRKLCILCLAFWLVSPLLAMAFDPNSEGTSPNGLYRCQGDNDGWSLYKQDRLIWRRPPKDFDSVLAVSNEGWLVLQEGFKVGLLVAPAGRTLRRFEGSISSAWFGAVPGRLCLERQEQIYVTTLKINSPVLPITREQVRQECANPQAEPKILLEQAIRSQLRPPTAFLHRCVQRKELRWQALGLQARLESQLAGRLLHLSHRGEEAGWLNAVAIARPERVLSELRKLRGRSNHSRLFTDAICDITESQPEEGKRLLLAFLKAEGNLDLESAELIRILGYNPAPELNALFSSLAAGRPKDVEAAAVRALIEREQLNELRPLLRQPTGRHDILRHLQTTPDPASVELLEELLNQPQLDPVTLALVMDGLRFQCRLNLGHDRAGWQAWLRQRHPGQERLSQLPKSQLTGLLAAAWEGRLTDADLRGAPRLERVFEMDAMDQHKLLVDTRGEWLVEDLTPIRLTQLATGKVTRLDNQAGPHGVSCMCGLDLDLRRQVWDENDRAEVREFPSGKLINSWSTRGLRFAFHQVFSAAGRLVAMRGKIWEVSSGLSLYSLPEELRELSSSQSLCLAGQKSPILFDYARQKTVLELEPWPAQLKFSQDGKSVLCQGTGLKIYDLAGHCQLELKGWSGWGDVSADAHWVVDCSDGELRLTHAGQTQRLAISQPLVCYFNQDATQVLAVYPETIVIHRVPDLQVVAHWPLPGSDWWDYDRKPQWCGTRAVTWKSLRTMIWNTSGQPLSAPPQHQRLLSELWTGNRLQGGLPVSLTPAEYQARCLRWRQLGGGDWSVRPQSVLPDRDRSGWLVVASLLALASLALLWKIR